MAGIPTDAEHQRPSLSRSALTPVGQDFSGAPSQTQAAMLHRGVRLEKLRLSELAAVTSPRTAPSDRVREHLGLLQSDQQSESLEWS
jgi:hypothetical protein